MYVDLWGWFQRYEQTAIANNDPLRQRLVTLAREGWHYRELADADRAITTFKEGAMLADQLHEPCWVVFHKYWVAEMLFYLKHDYQATLDYVVRVVTECRKIAYEDCPVRSRVFFVLANIYYMIDFYGYEEQITDLLNLIENDIAMDEDTHLRLLHMRAQIDYDHEDYQSAEDRTKDMLGRSQLNLYRQRSGYSMLRTIAYAQGDIPLAFEYARIAEHYAINIQIQRSIAENKLWMAVYLQRMGDDIRAQAKYHAGLDHYERYQIPKEFAYHTALSEYHELIGDAESAIEYQRLLVNQTMAQASIYNQMMAQLDYCRTLGRLGKPIDVAMSVAHQLSDDMLDSTVYLQKLDAISAGNFYEFEWQRNA